MSSTTHNIGGSKISLEIHPLSRTTPVNPRIAADVQSFLSLPQKLAFSIMDKKACMSGAIWGFGGVVSEIGQILVETEAPPILFLMVLICFLSNPLLGFPNLPRINLREGSSPRQPVPDLRGSPEVSRKHRLLIVGELLLEVV